MDNLRQRDLLQEFIKQPKHKGLTEDQMSNSFESTVAACEDIFHIYVNLDNDIVKEAKFEGAGCAISFGAVEALLRVIEGKSKSEVEEILDLFEKLIQGEVSETNFEELDVFEIVQSHVSRKKCAMAPIGAVREAIK